MQEAQSINNLRITKERVKAWSACTDGFRWFLGNFPQGGEFADVYAALHDAKRYSDGDWLVERVFAELDTPCRVAQTVVIAGANAATTGEGANAATTGEGANAATTGEGANAATTGDWANAATTGEGANAATTGYRANAATTGYRANAATTGYRANAATTGDWANAATTGDWANAATTGDWANAATTGEGAVAVALGNSTKAKASAGGAIVIVWRAPWPSKDFKIFASKVGENGIKPDVWYQLGEDGAPVESSEQ